MRISVISYHSSPMEPVGSGSSGGMTVFLSNLYRRLGRYSNIDIFTVGKEDYKNIGPARVIFINKEDLGEFTEKVLSYHNILKYDLVHTHYWLSGIIGLKISRILNIPWIHSFHTVEFLKGIIGDRERIEVEDDIIKYTDFIISPTDMEAESINRRFRDAKIITIPHGVDIRNFKSNGNGNSNLLFVGRIAPIKGLDVLINALKYVKGKFTLNIIGGISKRKDYFNSIKSNSERFDVNFIGTVPHGKLFHYYNDSSMVIVPSYYESFGLVGLESMVSSKPVIGLNDTGLIETVGNDAGILIKRDEKTLAKAIDYLIENKSFRYRLGVNGRRKALKYRWSNIVRRYLNIYEKIIKN